jgi:NAD(P)-dependent dehydrogenase (short-subunit alcohol dehydrogenase family)
MGTHQTWFITGSSRGFGRALTRAALDAGDAVVATARRPEQLAELVETYGDRILPVALDVTDAAAATSALRAGVGRFGRIDVIVNNAGYANVSPVETTPEEEFRRQFETNFWGVYHVSTAAVPILKAQGGGIVVQFSSIGGRVGGTPGLGSYQAAKFAIDGLTRVLAAETGPLGIRYLVVEPGGFATDWAGTSMELLEVPADYRATVGAFTEMIRSSNDNLSAGDPERAARILVRVVKREDLPSHLVLGAGAAAAAIQHSRSQLAEATAWQAVSASADFGATHPVALPADQTRNG